MNDHRLVGVLAIHGHRVAVMDAQREDIGGGDEEGQHRGGIVGV
jgi:hypothetical protein